MVTALSTVMEEKASNEPDSTHVGFRVPSRKTFHIVALISPLQCVETVDPCSHHVLSYVAHTVHGRQYTRCV